METKNGSISSEHLDKIFKFINGIFISHEGIKTNAAKIILYRLVELALVDRNRECMADCRGMSVSIDTNAIEIMMPIENVISPLEEVKKALSELHGNFLEIEDNRSHYCYRLLEGVSIYYEEPSHIGFRINGDVWRAICNFAICFGMDYITTHKDTLYSVQLAPEQEEQYIFIKSTLCQILDGDNSDQYMIAAKKIVCAGELESMYFKFKYYEAEMKRGKMPREKMVNTIIKILREDFQIYFKPSNKDM